jgi:hypothetical protein
MRPILKHYRLGLAALACLLWAAASHAAQYPARTLDQMCAEAQNIVHGRVVGSSAARGLGGHVWTTYVIEIDEALLAAGGKSPRQITIVQLGGTVADGSGTMVAGIPQFSVKDEVVLFTRDYGAGWQSVQNGPQGALLVQTRKTVNKEGRESLQKALPGTAALYGGDESLDAFKARIRAALATIAKEKEARS